MEKVYEKLLLQLARMTPEQKVEEWEALKTYNEIGPGIEDYISFVEDVIVANPPIVSDVTSSTSTYFNPDFYLAA